MVVSDGLARETDHLKFITILLFGTHLEGGEVS
jgi:hypothetical protein